jgi:Flp pilus assembly protein TadG
MAMQICKTSRNTARRLSGRLRQERGQTLVEFAIVLPVLVLIILGILYFGRYEDYANQETQLAEEGVRWAAVNNNPSTVTGQTLAQYIVAQAQPELKNGSTDVTSPAVAYVYQPSSATYAEGQPIRVCLVATVVFPSPIGTPTATIVESATMRIEQTPSGATSSPLATATPSASTGCPLT